MVIRRSIVILLATAVLASPAQSFAQSERGSITGVVQDTTKGAIPGVAVNVINTATNATTTVVSSESGAYSAANLPPGPYRIEASLTGFRTAKVDGIRLTAGATQRVDVILDLGAISESVTVVARTPWCKPKTRKSPPTCRTNRSTSSRSWWAVRCAARSTWCPLFRSRKAAAAASSSGGGQGGAFGATLDGISVNTNRAADTAETAFLTPSVEAITEFAVETNGFKPEFGQAAGGAITFASKSGTNAFHGSVYNFLRNDALDRKGFFEAQKGIYRQNNYGASWGGPVQIPHVYDGKNRTFFFVAFEGFQNRSASNALTQSVPTPEMYNGDFSNWVNSQGQQLIILRSGDHTGESQRRRVHPRSVPRQQDSRRPVQRRREAIPRAGEIGGGPESCRTRSRHLRLRVKQLSLTGQKHARDHEQVQPEDRSHAQQHASRVVRLQPDEQRGSNLGTRVRRAFPCRSTRFSLRASMPTFTARRGTGSGRGW